MGGKPSRDKASSSRALCTVRSASLDSISTSVSQRTLHSTNGPPHSPSMDTISKHTGTNKKLTTKESKGNVYILLETASTDCETASIVAHSEVKETENCGSKVAGTSPEERGSEKTAACHEGENRETGARLARKLHLTTSLPAEVERCGPVGAGGVSTHTATEMVKRKHPNTNKSKLVQRVLPTRSHSSRAVVKPTSVQENNSEMEREVEQLLESMLKQQQESNKGHTHTKDASHVSTAQLPEALLQCSHKELNHLASYICHTIKDTLQSSLVEQALTAQQQKSTERTAHKTTTTSPTKHVQINEDPVHVRTASDGSESPHNSGSGNGSGEKNDRAAEDRLHRRRHKRPKRERPVSTPGVYWKEDPHLNLSDPQTSQTHSTSPVPANELQTHSNEESYYHRCNTEDSPDAGSRRTTTCRACKECSRNSPNATEQFHNGARRKRVGRSKDVPVDVSLDDNCPGVNIVRRRYAHHHHAVCNTCLQSLGKETFCRQSRRQQKQAHSPDLPSDLQLSPEGQEVRGVGEGSGFITLYQLRTVAKVLKESAGYEDQNVQQYEKSHKKSSGPPKSQSFRQERRHQYRAKSKPKNVVFDDCLSVAQREPSQPTEDNDAIASPSTPERERLRHFQDLVYPMKHRSGRDSPATDMAVIDLSVDSPCMLQPLEKGTHYNDSTYTIQDNNSPNKVTHLHHHYHHIIHHGEP